ncbi:MAG: DUF2911 domain-containing protein [Flavobacteriaceae bacterium]|nr:DUF2911 domain-containing protein [Flavobacteriaceae bacterium]
MKKIASLILLITAFVASPVAAQEFSGLDKSPADIATYPSSYKISDKKVKVVYSRPQLKGRSISELAPAGSVWRTGANESAEITFYQDTQVGGEMIKAGTYSLFTIPGENEWTVILNKNLNQWGAYTYDESGDVARFKAGASEGSESLEAFSIAFKEVDEGAHMVMGWGKNRVALPMSF